MIIDETSPNQHFSQASPGRHICNFWPAVAAIAGAGMQAYGQKRAAQGARGAAKGQLAAILKQLRVQEIQGKRDIATGLVSARRKVGQGLVSSGLGSTTIRASAETALQRLRAGAVQQLRTNMAKLRAGAYGQYGNLGARPSMGTAALSSFGSLIGGMGSYGLGQWMKGQYPGTSQQGWPGQAPQRWGQ